MTTGTADAGRGLYKKYDVARTDGSSGAGGKHECCDYFVLDLDHDRLAWAALENYARAAEIDFPLLADDLYTKLARGKKGVFSSHFCTGERGEGCDAEAVIPLGNGVMFCVEHAKVYDEKVRKHLGAPGLGHYALGAIERRSRPSNAEAGESGDNK